jgi:hypothetical protein
VNKLGPRRDDDPSSCSLPERQLKAQDDEYERAVFRSGKYGRRNDTSNETIHQHGNTRIERLGDDATLEEGDCSF